MLAGPHGGGGGWGERAIAAAERLGDRECSRTRSTTWDRPQPADDGATGIALVERSLALALARPEGHRARLRQPAPWPPTREIRARRAAISSRLAIPTEHDPTPGGSMLGWLAVCEFWEGRYAEAAAHLGGRC
jgi:hypothetical protein